MVKYRIIFTSKTACLLSLLLLVFFLPAKSVQANFLDVSGSLGNIEIKRSVSDNWSAETGLSLAAENTLATPHKIVITVSSVDPGAWFSRSLRVSLDDQASWQSVNIAIAAFHAGDLVINGSLRSGFDFVTNMGSGLYPANGLTYEGRANVEALPGGASLSITYTLMSHF